MALTPPRPLLEPDDRSRFDCGRDSMNAWFRRHGWTNHANNISRISVITDVETGRVIGYVSLSAAQIERAFLPKTLQRNRPVSIPVTLLGQLAVDRAYQRRGCAVSLLMFALGTALNASAAIGSMGVITHPLDDALRGFYTRRGFCDLPFDPRRAMFVRMSDIAIAFTAPT